MRPTVDADDLLLFTNKTTGHESNSPCYSVADRQAYSVEQPKPIWSDIFLEVISGTAISLIVCKENIGFLVV